MMLSRLASLSFVFPLLLGCTTNEQPKPDAKQTAKRDPPAKQEPAPKPVPKQDPPVDLTPSASAYPLIPGERIGAVRIGMSKADIEALQILTVHPQFSAMTIPITVYYDEAELAKTIETSLLHTDEDVVIDAITVPKTASVDAIRELLGDCEEPVVNRGATMHSCRGGKLLIAIGSGNEDEIWLRTVAP